MARSQELSRAQSGASLAISQLQLDQGMSSRSHSIGATVAQLPLSPPHPQVVPKGRAVQVRVSHGRWLLLQVACETQEEQRMDDEEVDSCQQRQAPPGTEEGAQDTPETCATSRLRGEKEKRQRYRMSTKRDSIERKAKPAR